VFVFHLLVAQFLSKLLGLLNGFLGFYGKIIYVHSLFCFL
jgi:hypothetical protein